MKELNDTEKKLLADVRKYYNAHDFDYAHRFDHILMVLFWAIELSKKEKTDMRITIPAAILHDIAIATVGDENHAKESAKLCKQFLEKYGYTEKEVEKISETIELHSTDDPSNKKRTLEGNILFDADKLDATGPVALFRWPWCIHLPEKRVSVYASAKLILEHLNKFRKKYGKEMFYTKTARKIAKTRMKYIENECKIMVKDFRKFQTFFDKYGDKN